MTNKDIEKEQQESQSGVFEQKRKEEAEKKDKRRHKAKHIAIPVSIVAVLVAGTVVGVVIHERMNETYNISYECDGVDSNWLLNHPFNSDSINPKSFKRSLKTISLNVPKIDGYEFSGWYLSGDTPKLVKDNVLNVRQLKSDISLIAKYQIITYNVSFQLNSGKLTGLSNNYFDNHKYVIDGDSAKTTYTCLDETFNYPQAERLGYDFPSSGWKNSSDNSSQLRCDTSLLEDINLYADWSLHDYSITYSFAGEGVDEFEDEIVRVSADTYNVEEETMLGEAHLEGYKFLGWFDDRGNQVKDVNLSDAFPSCGDLHFTGRFEPIEYTITYSDASNSDHSGLPTKYKRCSNNITIPDINPRGYKFNGWFSDKTTTYTHTNSVPHNSTGNIKFTADLELLTYRITFVTSGVDVAFVDTFNLKNEVITYTVTKSNFSLPENPSVPGYRFLEYLDENGEHIDRLITKGSIVGDKVYTAKFEPIDYTLTLVNTSNNTTQTRTYNIESSFSINDVSRPGYTFDGWFDNNNMKKTSIEPGDALSFENFTLTTQWTLNLYNITYSYSGLDNNEAVTNQNPTTFDYEHDIDFVQPSVTGYRFLGWTTPTSSVPSLNYSISKHSLTGDLALTANFEKIRYTILRSYKLNAVGATVEETRDYYVDTPAFTLPAIESDTRQFVGWKEKTTNIVYNAAAQFGGGMTSNYSLEAVWSYKGSGTASDPYQVFDKDQLEGITELDKQYILMNDITIAADSRDVWKPVGTNLKPFSGAFDGNNKTITLVISGDCKYSIDLPYYFGIFGYCSVGSNIHDLKIAGSIGTSDNRFDTELFGVVAASSNGSISNCESSVRSYLTSSNSSKVVAGGIVGLSNPASIINCGCTGSGILNILASSTDTVSVGGIAGQVSGGIVDNCYNRANIVSVAKNNSYAGGLLGENDYTSCAHISWTQDPSSVYPFSGSVNSSVIKDSGNPGMAQYNATYCITGNQAYSMESSNTETFESGVYYYIILINSSGTKASMTWGLYNGTDFSFDSSKPYFITYSLGN